MEELLNLITISNVNNRSFDVEINNEFTGEETVTVYPTKAKEDKLQARIVLNTKNENEFSRTILIGPNEYIKDSDGVIPISNPEFNSEKLLKNDLEYTVEIEKNGEIARGSFILSTYPGIVDCNVNSYGNRIITVDFKYPVKNLFKWALDKTHTHLTNFYLLYYGIDAENQSNESIGYIDIKDETLGQINYPFKVSLSNDGKRIEFQKNYVGLPLGENKLIVNYAKQQQNLSDYILDFFDKEIPVMGKSFVVTRDSSPASVVDVFSISRTEVVVKFDKPVVLIDSEMDALSINGNELTSESFERYGYGFNAIKYTLSSGNPIPVGESKITISSITDASGYKTQPVEKTIFVEAISPELLRVEQIVNDSENETFIKLVYSEVMNREVDGINSVINKDNYAIYDSNNNLMEISKIEITGNELEFKMTTEILPAGIYKLVVNNVTDELGTLINPNPTEFIFESYDYSVPFVKYVLATVDVLDPGSEPEKGPDLSGDDKMSNEDNSIVIMFNEPMNVLGVHSIGNVENYKLINVSNKEYRLDYNSEALPFNKNEWLRITIPENNNLFKEFELTDSISIGYTDIKDVKYVTNSSGNIYPFCETKNIDKLVNKLSIAESDSNSNRILITSDSTLRYVHDSGNIYENNIFYSVNKDDFRLRKVITPGVNAGDVAIAYGDEINILSAKLIDNMTIEFTVAKGTFDSSSDKLELSTVEYENIESLDIFGKRILGNQFNDNVINKVKSTLKGISFLKLNNTNNLKETNGQAIIAMKFTKDIAMISDDFTAIVKGNNPMPVGADPLFIGDPILKNIDGTDYAVGDPITTIEQSIFANKPSDVVILKIGVPDVVDNKSAEYFVSTSNSKGGIKTFDTNRNPIKEFSNLKAVELNNEKFEWKYVKEGSKNKYIFTLTFSDEVKINTDNSSSFEIVVDGTNQKSWSLELNDGNGDLIGTFVLNFLADQDASGITSALDTVVSQPPLELNKIIIEIADETQTLPDASSEGMFAVFTPEPYSIINIEEEHYINLDYQPPSEII